MNISMKKRLQIANARNQNDTQEETLEEKDAYGSNAWAMTNMDTAFTLIVASIKNILEEVDVQDARRKVKTDWIKFKKSWLEKSKDKLRNGYTNQMDPW